MAYIESSILQLLMDMVVHVQALKLGLVSCISSINVLTILAAS